MGPLDLYQNAHACKKSLDLRHLHAEHLSSPLLRLLLIVVYGFFSWCSVAIPTIIVCDNKNKNKVLVPQTDLCKWKLWSNFKMWKLCCCIQWLLNHAKNSRKSTISHNPCCPHAIPIETVCIAIVLITMKQFLYKTYTEEFSFYDCYNFLFPISCSFEILWIFKIRT